MGSTDSELDDSVWKINNEQREYYTKQFKKIQPNVHEVIKGPQARDFFLKSNLPNETLSGIWQMSDLNKDGALDLNEFCIAMHFVVAVKHGVDLPTILPHSLLPTFASYSEEAHEEVKNSSISDNAFLPSSPEVSSSDVEHTRLRYSGEGFQFKGTSSNRSSKQMEIPPIPPPRDKGHIRTNLNYVPATCSDSQEILHPTTTAQNIDDPSNIVKDSKQNVKIRSSKEISSSNYSSIVASSPPRLNRSSREITADSVKHAVRFSDHLDVLDDGSLMSVDKKMQKQELQARIRMLKGTNVTLSNLLTQLHMEWKSVSEERIALDILLQKEKQNLS